MQFVLGMGGFSYARIVNSGQSCVPMLLTFLHKTKEQLLVLLTFSQTWDLFSVCVVVLSKGRVICQDITTVVGFSTCCWFRRILRPQLSWFSVLRAATKVCVCVCVCMCVCVCVYGDTHTLLYVYVCVPHTKIAQCGRVYTLHKFFHDPLGSVHVINICTCTNLEYSNISESTVYLCPECFIETTFVS